MFAEFLEFARHPLHLAPLFFERAHEVGSAGMMAGSFVWTFLVAGELPAFRRMVVVLGKLGAHPFGDAFEVFGGFLETSGFEVIDRFLHVPEAGGAFCRLKLFAR